MNKIITTIFLMFVLLGCSASGPIYQKAKTNNDGMATLYIYRPYLFFNAGGWPNIYLNDEKLFALKNKGYGVVYIPPGEHTVKAQGHLVLTNWYPKPMEFTDIYEADKEYYIRVTPRHTSTFYDGTNMAMSGEAVITIVSEKDAIKEISETKKIY